MIGKPILSRFSRFVARFQRGLAGKRIDLHTAYQNRIQLPQFVQRSPTAQRYLELLGPLAWDRLPERNLERNWGQPTIPYTAFIPACLLKLNEGQDSMSKLRLFLVEHPEVVWLFGFPLAVSTPGVSGFDASASLPTARHLLRSLPNRVLQVLLADSVRLILEELRGLGVLTGDCISLDTKHILACVKENNPKAYRNDRYDKTRQPAGDPDCKLGCNRRHNRRKSGSDPGKPAAAAQEQSVGEFFWGYGSGVVVVKVPRWGEFVLAELTQTFDQPDVSYFFPLMAQAEERLGHKPRWGTFDCAFDAWYVYDYFHRADDPQAFAAVPFSEKGGYKAKGRQFSPDGLPLCAAGLPMPLKLTYWHRTKTLIEHERGRYACPLLFPTPSGESCPKNKKNWSKGGCTSDLPTSIAARLRYTLDRDSQVYKDIYKQRTAVERINSQAKALGIERPYLRNGSAVANQNSLIYLLINLRFFQRLKKRETEMA